jgi:hypothetical protein
VICGTALAGPQGNLYTVWHRHRLRQQAASEDWFVALTRLESRRAFAVVAMACLTIEFLPFEMVAHVYLHEHRPSHRRHFHQ